MTKLSILLLSPPLSEPSMANLAIELLAGQARSQGHEATTLHAALLQPESFRGNMIHGIGAPGVFAPFYYGHNPVDFVDELISALREDFHRGKHARSLRWDNFTDMFLAGTGEAERCVRRILDAIPRHRFDVIGFSVGFDAQKMPAAAVARALRDRGERGLFVVGGTGTDGPMGPALLEQFSEMDLVLQGEVEDSWPVLLDRIACGQVPDDVPGCVMRRGPAIIAVPETPASDTFLKQPLADYSSFIDQRKRSSYAGRRLILPLETSRGCWWGQRHHCTFCGIRNVDFPYRTRQPRDTVASLLELYDRYQPDLLYCTDSIAPLEYVDKVWPALAKAREAGRKLSIFYETKSNLRRRQIEVMSAAGVCSVQPGIESLITPSLQLMDKGATGLQQIAFLKWARTYGIETTYGLLTGMPGETSADLRGMAATMERIWHLPPPADVTRLVLHRFSPHFAQPAAYGLDDVRPFGVQRVIYRCPDERLMRLCYQLNFTVRDQGEDFEAARAEVAAASRRWNTAFTAGCTLSVSSQDGRQVVARISGETGLRFEMIDDPVQAQMLQMCAEVSSISKIAHLTGAPADELRAAAAALRDRGLMLLDRGSALSLPTPAENRAHAGVRPEPSIGTVITGSRLRLPHGKHLKLGAEEWTMVRTPRTARSYPSR